MTFRVRVVSDHIARGKRGSAFACPVSFACKGVLPYGSMAAVSKDHLKILGVRVGVLPGDAASVDVPFPPELTRWVAEWDAGRNPGPIEATLTAPDMVKENHNA